MIKTIITFIAVLFVIHLLFVSLILVVGEKGVLLLPSTRRFMKEAGFKRLLNPESFLHGYIYFKWLDEYVSLGVNVLIKIPLVGPFIVEKMIMPKYHAKTITHEQARNIIRVEKDIPLQDLEHIVPYKKAREFILTTPLEIAVTECACRNARKSSCQPSQVCMIMGQPFVDFVLEHSPEKTRKINQEEALELLEAEHKRGHVHSVWFKDASIDRLWAICNCCKCCCAGVQFVNNNGIPIMCSSGYVAIVDTKVCNNCGACSRACTFDAITQTEDSARVLWDNCLGCGVCIDKCKTGALTLVADEKKGIPLDINTLIGS